MNHKQVGFRQLLCEVRAFHIKFYESSIHESNTNLKTKPNMSKGNFCKGRPWIEGLKRDSKKFDSNPSSHPNQLYDFPNPSSKNRFFFSTAWTMSTGHPNYIRDKTNRGINFQIIRTKLPYS